MLNLFKVEFYKLKTNGIFWFLVLAGVGQAIVGPLASVTLRKMTGEDIFLYSLHMQQFIFLIPFIGVFAYYFVGCEFSTGVIKNLIAYGHGRVQIILSKSIAFYTGVIAICFAFPIAITLNNTAINGYGRSFSLQALYLVFRTGFLMSLIYIGIGSIIILLIFISKNAIITSVIFISLDSASRLGQAFSMRSKTVEAIYGKTVFYGVNYATLKDITLSETISVIAVSLITLLVLTTAAMSAFTKADIK